MIRIILDKIDQIVKYSIEDLYYGNKYKNEDINIPIICSDIIIVIDSFISKNFEEIKEDEFIKFFSSTFPCLIETFLRRKSLSEHEDCISNLFIKTAKLLTSPNLQDISELYELRNALFLTNFTQLKFLKLKSSSKSSKSNDSFFTEHGKPNVSITSSNVSYFWPDQWQNELGGQRALGHYVQIFLSESDQGTWYDGKVIKYNENNDLYTISFDKESSGNKDPMDISLSKVKHNWIDHLHETRRRSSTTTSQVSTNQSSENITAFRFSPSDEGLFIRIWWARYQRHFYGKVVSYDPITKRHTLIYDDGDVRSYDFSSKQYEIISPPTSLNLDSARSDVECAKLVAVWHQEHIKQNINIESDSKIESDQENVIESHLVHRPLASEAHHLSIYYLEALKTFFDNDGIEVIIKRLHDAAIQPPSCKVLLLHLQFIYNLRHLIRSVSLKDFIINLKEGIVAALHRYESTQFKDMTQTNFQQILFGLRDIVTLGNPQNTDINYELGLIQLTISAKLLRCPQLQKRYMGLAMIKEEIESAMPKVSNFLSKRHAAMSGVSKNGGIFSSFGNRQVGRRGDTFGGKIPLTCEELQRWIIDNNIIEEIFGKAFHQDLVTRSDTILVFMAQLQKISTNHLEVVWQSCRGAHEAVVRVVHHVILLIVPVLDQDLRMHLFTLISSTPQKDISEQTLYLIKAYTIQALAALREDAAVKSNTKSPAATPDKYQDSKNLLTHDQNSLGFGVLWQFVQDPMNAKLDENNQNLIDLAITLLVELMEEDYKDSRDVVMQRCLDNIKVGISTLVSLKILRRTLSIFPSVSHGWFGNVVGRSNTSLTVGSQIEKLQKQFGLLEIIFSDITRYHKSNAEHSLESTSSSSISKSVQQSTDKRGHQNEKINRITFIKYMEDRLDFLLFILTKSNLTLGEAQTMLLWKSLGENATNAELLEKLAYWLDALISRDNKLFNSLLETLAHESDPADPTIPSKLSCLGKKQLYSSGHLSGYDSQSQGDPEISNSFDDGVLSRLFEAHIVKWASAMENVASLSRPAVAHLCMKLFLIINISNRSIRVDADGTWFRVGALSGISVLWRIALDSTDKTISETAMALIIELHHRMPPRHASADTIKGSLLQICFRQLSISIQSLRQGDPNSGGTNLASTPPRQTQSADANEDVMGAMGIMGMQPISPRVQSPAQALNSSTSEDWLEDGETLPDASVIARRVARYIMVLRLFIRRFHQNPTQLINIQVLAGRDDSPIMSLTLNAGDTIGDLRSKIANHFKEPLESIIILKYGKNSYLLGANVGKNIERLDNNNATLSQSKFLPQETVVVKQKDANKYSQNSSTPGGNTVTNAVEDLITEKDLEGEKLSSLKPLSWLPFSVKDLNIYDMRKGDIVPRVQTQYRFRTEDYDVKSTDSSNYDKYHRITDYFDVYVKMFPQHIDQLLEILDGYLSIEVQGAAGSGFDLSSAIWDVLQSLPLHPPLMAQVEAMPSDNSGASIRRLLDLSSPYRLLYVLQIIDSLLSSADNYSSSKIVTDWSLKFLYLGGAEHLVSMIQTISKKCSTINDGHKKFEDRAFSRTDVAVLALAMLQKLLHRLLMHDPSFSSWQRISKIKVAPSLSAIDPYSKGADERIPSGLVLSSFQCRDFIFNSLNTLREVSSLYNNEKISLVTYCTLIKHTLSLFNGLCISSEDGLDILKSYNDFVPLLRSLCQHQQKQIRDVACQRLFEYFSNIWLLHSNVSKDFNDATGSRFSLFEYVFEIIITITIDFDSYCEQLYGLIGIVLILKSHPDMIFKINGNIIKELSLIIPESFDDVKYSKDDLCLIFAEKLLAYTPRETYPSSKTNGILLGILRIISVLAIDDRCLLALSNSFTCKVNGREESKDLISFLYLNCLFPKVDITSGNNEYNNDNNNDDIIGAVTICQTTLSRNLAFTLLYQLCRNNVANFCRLLRIMDMSIDRDEASETQFYEFTIAKHYKQIQLLWDYGPSLLVKDSDSSVGLANQGGTCYMNSFLQQLYSIPKFADRLLMIKQTSTSANANLLFQLQVLFGNLRISQKCYYDTLPFCKSFLDYDGNPISLSEQMDINEFAGMLFDRLEENEESRNTLHETVQGTCVWKTKSTESSYRSEREENFYMLTAVVKDKECLEDSLELFIAEELFSGDNQIEDDNGRKIDALRRCVIRKLPSTLIIHLKRFEFDLETLNRKKVNDLITFPMELNMFPYTEDGVNAKEFKTNGGDNDNDDDKDNQIDQPFVISDGNNKYNYALRGIVAHVGATDRGHYYSFIQDRESHKWMEFNDRAVLPFSQEAIPAECFGGEDAAQGPNKLRQNSAYLLFYERIENYNHTKDTITLPDIINNESLEYLKAYSLSGNNHDNITISNSNSSTNIDSNTNKNGVSKVMSAVWKENIDFQLHQYLFDKANFRFQYQILNSFSVDSLMASSSSSSSLSSLHISDENKRNIQRLILFYLGFVIDIVAHGRAISCITLFFERLEEIITRDQSNTCAKMIINLLASDYNPDSNDDDGLNPNTNNDSDVSSTYIEVNDGKGRKAGKIHPWLAIFLSCPHGAILKSYSKFLRACVKSLRPENPDKDTYITYGKEVVYTLTSVVDMDEYFNPKPCLMEIDSRQHRFMRQTETGVSLLTKFIDKMITVAERMGREGIARNEGYVTVSNFLLTFSLSGFEERRMLLAIGAIHRMVLSLLSANSVVNNANEDFSPCIDLVTLLVRSCMVINPESPVPVEMYENKERILAWQSERISSYVDRAAQVVLDKQELLPCLNDKDIHAFLNRFFLENAVNIASSSISQALQHICWSRMKDAAKILEFLAEKVGESVMSNGGIKLSYRYYFRVISEMLMGPTVNIPQVFDSVIPSLVDKADYLSGRQGENDPEYIYAVFKLLHRIGTISHGGHSCIMKIKESWKSIRSKYLYHRKRDASYYSQGQQQPSDVIPSMSYMGMG